MEPALKTILEALFFAADEPLPIRRLSAIVEEASPAELRDALAHLAREYDEQRRPLQLVEVAGGWQLLTRPEFAPWLARLSARAARGRLSQPALETLAIVAYKQPVTRAELEEIRGVNVEAVLKTLVERDLVSIVGRDEGLGRALLYGTTPAFLRYFGLRGTEDLPRMEELEIFLTARDADATREMDEPEDAERTGAATEATGGTASRTGSAAATRDVEAAELGD